MINFYKLKPNTNWRLFILFIVISLIVGLVIIYILFPSIFQGPEIRRIPIIFDEEPKTKVEQEDILKGPIPIALRFYNNI